MKKILVFAGILVFAVACSSSGDKQAKLDNLKKEHDKIAAQIASLEKELYPEGQTQATMVMVDTIKKRIFEHFIEVQGRVDGNENIAVSPRTPGVVSRILVVEGDHVTKGQILAELDAEVLKQQLNDLNTQLGFVTELYNKQKELWDQKIGSEVQYLTAKNNMESLQNKIATLKDQISMSSITAPIDGTIEEIPIKVGQMAAAGTPSFRIVNFSKAKVMSDVGEANTAKIKTGDQVRVFLPDLNVEFTQTVTFASKYINPVNRTFLVEASLQNDDIEYRANMIAILRIKDYTNPSCIAIPQGFIQSSRTEGNFAYVVAREGGKKIARKKYLKTGITYNGLTEITEGLSEGDLLITAGYKDLYDGQVIDFK
jgi:RND family efflux transporter MFP subunit